MRRVAAPLAAILCALAAAGCGDGAEPGAPRGATLMLDFTPNAVHTGIYVAQRRGYFEDEGIELTIREPSATSDAPKLLEAGRVDFAILDINDAGLARARGVDLEAVGDIVQVPLAAVIAGDPGVRRPRDLEGETVGVTGVPSDQAVLESVVESDGGDPQAIETVNIGFNAVAAIASHRVDAATSFWNAEGVQLRAMSVPTREFRVADEVDLRFPELLLVTTEGTAEDHPDLVKGALRALERAYRLLHRDPDGALDDFLAEVPAADREGLAAQLRALLSADAFAGPRPRARPTPAVITSGIAQWIGWSTQQGLVQPSDRRQLLQLLPG